jgi:beta-lactamase regulating signal transducer with metallopeptidase domain
MNVLNEATDKWAQLILHAGWQAAVVAGLIFIFIILARRLTSAQFRYVLLLIVLLKFVTPPFLSLPTGLLSNIPPVRSQTITVDPTAWVESTTISSSDSTTKADEGTTEKTLSEKSVKTDSTLSQPASLPTVVSEPSQSETGFQWLFLLLLMYLSGIAGFGIMLIRRYRSVRRIVQASEIQQNGFLKSEMDKISKQLRMKSLPELRISDDTDAPFAIGVFRPVIVLPRLIDKQLQPDQLSIVIAHELVHVRRRDLLIGWIETVVSIVWWFHPAMWWLKKSLRQTREDCCDDILLANELAEPERYCETLIEAAANQTMVLAEPLALGFTQKEHPVARRIRRLMDGSLLRRDRLRIPAIILALLLVLLVLPGMKPDRMPVSKTTLEGMFGWKNLPFNISKDEKKVLEECRQIAQTNFSRVSKNKVFNQSKTRERLESILEEHPNLFYAQQLLGTWHRDNGDPQLSKRLMNASLNNAPVVLSLRYVSGNGHPVIGVEIPQLEIELNRVQNHSLDPSLHIKFVNLITDSNGEVHLPVYDTVYRLSSYSYPVGCRAETKSLGWFESKAHNGVLPEVLIWKPWSQPRDFKRSASDSQLLANADGTNSLELKSGANRYKIGYVARGQADNTFIVENGKGKNQPAILKDLPVIKNGPFMDHAVINISNPLPSRYEIAQTHVLDSQTKIDLHAFQQSAGFKQTGKQQFHLFSWADPLPNRVDLVLKVHNFDGNYFQVKIPAKVGPTIQYKSASFTITHLIAGQHPGWSSKEGFYKEPQDTSTTSEMMIDIKGNEKVKYSIWTILKNGRRLDMKRGGGWYSARLNSMGPIRIMVPLEEIDHFEVLPYAEPVTIYFENLQLPSRETPLEVQFPMIEFAVGGKARKFTSDFLSPMLVHFESRRGLYPSRMLDNSFSSGSTEGTKENRYSETYTTVNWRNDCTVDFNHNIKLILRGTEKFGRSMGMVTGSHPRFMVIKNWDVPVEAVQSVRLQFLPKPIEF